MIKACSMSGGTCLCLLLACCAGFLAACGPKTDLLAPVPDFDIERYAGRWYEIARLPHRFERNLMAVTADYTVNDDGTVAVANRGYNATDGEWRDADGRARFTAGRDVGSLEVSFFGPFYGPYKVIRLERERYDFSVVTSGTFDYFWILSRTPTMVDATLAGLVEFAASVGFDVSKLEYPDQSMNVGVE